jgi:hypothetical protein
MCFKETNSDVTVVRMRFHNTQAAYVHGSFNNWNSTATSMASLGDDLWEVMLPPDTNFQELSFFVIARGETVGHIWQQSQMIEHVQEDGPVFITQKEGHQCQG